MNFEVVQLEKSHNRKVFQCEEPSLTSYLQRQVSQDVKNGLVLCFVVVNDESNVVGYYTLSSQSLPKSDIPEKFAKKLPENYNVPVVLLGRLARDLSFKGQKLGEHLLLDALFRSLRVSQKSVGAMAVVVDPLSKTAADFYERFGFVLLPDSGKMMLPMKNIHALKKIVG